MSELHGVTRDGETKSNGKMNRDNLYYYMPDWQSLLSFVDPEVLGTIYQNKQIAKIEFDSREHAESFKKEHANAQNAKDKKIPVVRGVSLAEIPPKLVAAPKTARKDQVFVFLTIGSNWDYVFAGLAVSMRRA